MCAGTRHTDADTSAHSDGAPIALLNACEQSCEKCCNSSEIGVGKQGQNVPNTGGPGGTRPESWRPSKVWTFDPKLTIFYRLSVGRGQFQGPLKIHPPPIFGDSTPACPGLQAKLCPSKTTSLMPCCDRPLGSSLLVSSSPCTSLTC